MAYKDILIYLDPSPGAEDRLRLAAGLAQTHMARLIGVDASSNDAFLGASAERAIQIGDRFAEAVRAAGIVGHCSRSDDPKGDHFPDYSHCVDLVIAPRPEGDAKELVRSFIPDQLVMHAGVPVLILPQEWKFGPVGQNIVIAWNASREATRAVHDAMPLLKKARKVTIFAFSSARSGLRASADLLPSTWLVTKSRRTFPTGPTPATLPPSRRCSRISTPRTPTSSSRARSATRACSRRCSAASPSNCCANPRCRC